MAGYISSIEREKSTTKITIPGKDLIQNWWRNKKLFRQAKLREFSTTKPMTNVKETYIVKKIQKEKKIYKIKPQEIKKMAIE